MSTLRRYITGDFLVTTATSMAVLTFVMSVGMLFKATEYLGRGGEWSPIVRMLATGIPVTLTFAVPVAVLTGCLLVYGRLSADSEITAMRACGAGVWTIMSGPLSVALLLGLACVYVNNDLAPRGHYARRTLKSELGKLSTLDLLEEGRFIQDFKGMTVYIGRRSGMRLNDIRIYDLRKRGVKREIKARTGLLRSDETGQDVVLDLRDVRVDPFLDERPGAMTCERWPIRISGGEDKGLPPKRANDMTTGELSQAIAQIETVHVDMKAEDRAVERASMLIELNRRFALAAACFSFAFLGIPLGIKTHRRESSVGVGISLLVVLLFYMCMIFAESLADRPEFRPHLVLWTPVAVSGVLGWWLVGRLR